MDMGGLESRPESVVKGSVKAQIEKGLREADLLLLLLDARDGLLADDWDMADVVRRSEKPMILVANKVDRVRHEGGLLQLYELGMGEPLAISAYHRRGIEDLLDQIIERLPAYSPPEAEPSIGAMRVSIVGRPNVGKSMLLNALLGQERVIVDDVPGTTRDAVDTVLEYEGDRVLLVDTAGMRRRGRIEQGVEKFSALRGLESIERSDVALLVVDATEGLSAQDTHILGYAKEAYKGAIIAVNKWDLVVKKNEDRWRDQLVSDLRFMPYVPILFVSAKTGHGVAEIMPTVVRVCEERLKRIPDPLVEAVIREAMAAHPPPSEGAKHFRLKRVAQTDVNPPTFVFQVNDAKLVHFTYQRYLEKSLRRRFGFEGTSLHLVFRGRSAPYRRRS
jgi:GTP-binding protein